MIYKEKKFKRILKNFILDFEYSNDLKVINSLRKLRKRNASEIKIEDLTILCSFLFEKIQTQNNPLLIELQEEKDWIIKYLEQLFIFTNSNGLITITKRKSNG